MKKKNFVFPHMLPSFSVGIDQSYPYKFWLWILPSLDIIETLWSHAHKTVVSYRLLQEDLGECRVIQNDRSIRHPTTE